MNTKRLLGSPLVQLSITVAFLLFSAGCTKSPTPESPRKEEKGETEKTVAKSAPPVTPEPKRPTVLEPAKFPDAVPSEPVPPEVAPVLPAVTRQTTTESAPAVLPKPAETAPSVQEEDHPNPLRMPENSADRPRNGIAGRAIPQITPSVVPPVAPPSTPNSSSPTEATPPGTGSKEAVATDNTSPKDITSPKDTGSQAPDAIGKIPLDSSTKNDDRANSDVIPPVKKSAPTSPKEQLPPFDPIKENGEFFVGWSKPKLALLITGKIEGYLEPCGCAGMERMKGGMARRYTLFKQLREQGWPVVGLDVGGMARGFGRQAEIKFHTLVEGMRQMDYDGVTLGESDLKLPAGELVAETAPGQSQKSPFVSANVGLFGLDSEMIVKSRIVKVGNQRIGITGILGKSFQKQLQNSEVEFADPEVALKGVLPDLMKQSDLRVLLAHATMEESIALAKRFPEFQVVVTSGGEPEPPAEPKKLVGSKTLFIEVGTKGMNAIVLGFFDDRENPVRYQRVTLDSRFPSAPSMKNLMAAYQDQLKSLGFEGLGLRPAPHPMKESGGKFVGSDKCKSCHEVSDRVWRKSPHAKAYETLVKLDPPRNFDPECVSCHVVGWHPSRFFPYETGYASAEKTPKLVGAGCENCHGPGEFHCKAEEGSDQAKMDKYRKACVITKAQSEKDQCRTCHDGDNSPNFNFEKYWPFVEHYEKKE